MTTEAPAVACRRCGGPTRQIAEHASGRAYKCIRLMCWDTITYSAPDLWAIPMLADPSEPISDYAAGGPPARQRLLYDSQLLSPAYTWWGSAADQHLSAVVGTENGLTVLYIHGNTGANGLGESQEFRPYGQRPAPAMEPPPAWVYGVKLSAACGVELFIDARHGGEPLSEEVGRVSVMERISMKTSGRYILPPDLHGVSRLRLSHGLLCAS